MGCLPRLPPGRKGRSREAPVQTDRRASSSFMPLVAHFRSGKRQRFPRPGLISENSRVEITFYFFMGITSFDLVCQKEPGLLEFHSPDCSSMHRRVLTGMSLSGCLTVGAPF